MTSAAGLPDPHDTALVAALPPHRHTDNAIPDQPTADRRERAAGAAAALLADEIVDGGMVTSPLGPGWDGDLDIHVRRLPPPGPLRQTGWLPLDGLLVAIGERAQGRWAAADFASILAAVDLHLGPPPRDPVQRVLRRCRRRGEVRLREVLELRVLHRQGLLTPATTSQALSAAAAAEATLGQHQLRDWRRDGILADPPVPLPLSVTAQWRRRVDHLRRALRPRMVLALSGVDGAGKSTLARQLHHDLTCVGVPCSIVWARPGNNLGRLASLADYLKRLLRHQPTPGIEVMAQGHRPQSRTGLLGTAWTTVVTLAYLSDTWRQYLRSCGVVIFDRHLLDAIATLEFGYAGTDLRLPLALVRRLLPAATLTCYLDVVAEHAVARKPGDVLALHAISAQLTSYAEQIARHGEVHLFDASDPVREIARSILEALVALSAIPDEGADSQPE